MKKKSATKKKNVPRELSPRARLFVAEYLKDLNATQAAIRAGYSARTAGQQGSRLLKNAQIAEAIAASVKQREEKALSDVEFLRRRLREEIEADVYDIFNEDGSAKPIKDWPLIWRKGLVTGLEVRSATVDDEDSEEEMEPQGHGGSLKRRKKPKAIITTIKWADRKSRIEMFGRHVDVQAWKDRKEVSADEPLTKLFEQIAGQAIRPRQT